MHLDFAATNAASFATALSVKIGMALVLLALSTRRSATPVLRGGRGRQVKPPGIVLVAAGTGCDDGDDGPLFSWCLWSLTSLMLARWAL